AEQHDPQSADRAFGRPKRHHSEHPPLVTSNKARAEHHLPPLTNPDGTPEGSTCCARNARPRRSLSMSSSLARTRLEPTPSSSTDRRTDTSTVPAIYARTGKPPTTDRCSRSNCVRRTASTGCPTWRFGRTAQCGRRNAHSPTHQSLKHDRLFSANGWSQLRRDRPAATRRVRHRKPGLGRG